ncbi:ankyrin repeat-containing domain protein [Hypoxylon trugodes]|uniref:ankyrin repeat-containing domain protein n=1 Tax=Hypoxylon trugodes TaxID=326681 RepID=UPI002197A221|nr:ankyrin repeat-containing domain protein [Hypoxylon trugodes]KAI1390634.1 ankyrin repeat-containing domain protein [Hypoxylon trugodes]
MFSLTDLFETLSDEFIQEIVEWIATSWDPQKQAYVLSVRDLANLSYVNQDVHKYVNPILYQRESETHGRPDFLHYALRHNNVNVLRIAHEAEALRFWWNWQDLMTEASILGHYDIIEWALNQGFARDELAEKYEDKELGTVTDDNTSDLGMAIGFGHKDIAMLLIRRGANTLLAYTFPEPMVYDSALHLAVVVDMFQLVEYLVLEKGISVNVQYWENKSPLYRAIPEYKTGEDPATTEFKGILMLKKLISLGADINHEANGLLPLTFALQRYRYAHAATLLNAGAKLRPDRPYPGVPFPIQACVMLPFEIRALLDRQRKMFEWLVELGADIEECYIDGHCTLITAFLCGVEPIRRQALEACRERDRQRESTAT